MALGLSYPEARGVPVEEVLCLLYHAAHRRRQLELGREAEAVSLSPFGERHEREQALARLRLAHASNEERFLHPPHTGIKEPL